MSKRPLIAITAGEVQNYIETWAPVTVGQGYPYIEAIVRAGGTPFIIPITADGTVRRQLYELADGIVFAGGNDINPKRYGQTKAPKTVDVSAARDSLEWQLMEWTLADDKPLLAICRGMQLLNVALGGSLYQDITTDLLDTQDHQASMKHLDAAYLAHDLRLESGSRLGEILSADTIKANSRHHQAVRELGAGLMATAWAEDGVIEAIELPSKSFTIGVQSHPESLESAIEPTWRALFEAFVGAAS